MRTVIRVLCLFVALPGCATAVTQAELDDTRRALENSSRDLDAAATQLEEANSRLAAMEEEQERARKQIQRLTLELRARNTPAPAPKVRRKPRLSRAIEGAEDAIECAAELKCTVDRKWLQHALQVDVLPQARVVPSSKDGEIQGIELYGISRGTVPDLLGLRNGDMIRTIGGNAVRSEDDLVREIEQAKGMVKVELVSKGLPMSGRVKIK